MTKKKIIIKVKVRKSESNNDQDNKTPHAKNDEILSPSTELLKGIISLVFMLLTVICVLIALLGSCYLLSENSSVICRAMTILNIILILSQLATSIIYYFHSKKEKLLKVLIAELGVSLIISTVCLFLSAINTFSEETITTLVCFLLVNFSAVLASFFAAITDDISNEKDKNYIVGYFSALTAFSALIVSLVALLK